jgi:hypothetical protein
MNEKIDLSLLSEPHDIEATPEHILWLAVVDRAMIDYVRRTLDLTSEARRSLSWFLFSREPEPCNLPWISLMLYGDNSMTVKVLRRIRQLKSDSGDSDHFHRIQHRQVRHKKLPALLVNE